MINRSNALFLVLILSVYHQIINTKCPPKSKTANPFFLLDPPNTLSGVASEYFCATCCFDGFTEIFWDFRQLNDRNWSSIYSKHRFQDENRELCLINPYASFDDGYYRCLAIDNYGGKKFHSIFIYFLTKNEPRYITINFTKPAPKMDYKVGMDVELSCEGESYIPNETIVVQWLYKIENSFSPIVRAHKINTTILTAVNKSLETNPDLVSLSSSFQMYDVQPRDQGTYVCLMTQGNFTPNRQFKLMIIDDRLNIGLLLSIILGILSVMTFFSLIWYQRYRIMVIYKIYFNMCPANYDKEFDVSILYFEDDIISIHTAIEIANILENYQFRCWVYDRDKHYGQETIVDQSTIMSRSHTVLVLISLPFIGFPLLTNLSSLQPNPTVRRLYICRPNVKKIFEILHKSSPLLEMWLKQELNLQSFFRPHSYSWNPDRNPKINHLFEWIVASLPSSAIRVARHRIMDTYKNNEFQI